VTEDLVPRATDNSDEMTPARTGAQTGLPDWLVWTVGALCALPVFMFILGADFGSVPLIRYLPGGTPDEAHQALSGSFTHLLLEWTAVGAALLTALLALIHFRLTRDVTVPILGLALLFAGSMDAFHGLASVRLLAGDAQLDRLIPMTWMLARTFATLVLVAGVVLVMLTRGRKTPSHWLVSCVAGSLVVTAWFIIVACARADLPRMIWPLSLLTRPWDLLPMGVIGASAVLLYTYHRRFPGPFSHALLISLVPAIAAQLYMAFGASALFNAHFNIAHMLKIVAYGIPLVGLLLEYERAFADRAVAENRFKLAVTGTSEGLWEWNPQTNEVWFATRFKELLGYRDDELPHRLDSFNEHLHPDDHERVWTALRAHLDQDEYYDIEHRLRTKQGQYRWFRARGLAVRDSDGRPLRMAGFIHDITDRKAAVDQLDALSKRLAQTAESATVDPRTDPTTEVMTRRAMEDALVLEDQRSRRYDHVYALMKIDLDHFQSFNDATGLLAGDECLKQIAHCIRTSCRVVDVVGRYGGQDFIVVIPETDTAGAAVAGQRILETVRAAGITHPGIEARVTVSIGIASGPGEGGWQRVVAAADDALHRAKTEGRDRVAYDGQRGEAA
jgi:diguanylate cyclase (GGDEF)-like protein/PAS domain S-box-containing protein